MPPSPLREFANNVLDAFSGVFRVDVDPSLSEEENVEKTIHETGIVAGLIALLQPLPAPDLLVLTPLYAKLALQIGRIKGFEIEQERAREIVSEILSVAWLTLSAQALIGAVGKVVPFARLFLTYPMNYGATWAIGHVTAYYFDCLSAGDVPEPEALRRMFREQLQVGRKKGEAFERSDLAGRAEELRQRVLARDPSLRTTTRIAPRERILPASFRPSASPPTPAPADGSRRKIRIVFPKKTPRPQRPEPADNGEGSANDPVANVAIPRDAAPEHASSPATAGNPLTEEASPPAIVGDPVTEEASAPATAGDPASPQASARSTAGDSPRDATNDLASDAAGGSTRDATGEPARDAARDATGDPARSATGGLARDATADTARDATADTARDATDHTARDTTADTARDATDHTARDTTDHTARDTTDHTARNTTADTVRDATDATARDATDHTARDATDHTARDATDHTARDATHHTARDATDATARETTGDAPASASRALGAKGGEGEADASMSRPLEARDLGSPEPGATPSLVVRPDEKRESEALDSLVVFKAGDELNAGPSNRTGASSGGEGKPKRDVVVNVVERERVAPASSDAVPDPGAAPDSRAPEVLGEADHEVTVFKTLGPASVPEISLEPRAVEKELGDRKPPPKVEVTPKSPLRTGETRANEQQSRAAEGAKEEARASVGKLVDQLERLARLKEQGALTDLEFQRAKARLLKSD